MKDPLVTEVRTYRMEHAKKFNFDIHAICADLRKYQDELYAISEIDKNNRYANKIIQPTLKNRYRADTILLRGNMMLTKNNVQHYRVRL